MPLVVITGGTRSGKSSAAERLAQSRARDGAAVTVAVFASESDSEMTERIALHRASRPEGFGVVEVTGSDAWLDDVPRDSLLLVDCLGTCCGLAMLETWERLAPGHAGMTDAEELPAGFTEDFSASVRALVDHLIARDGDTIVVTNETGSGIVPAYATGRIFRDELGRANAALIGAADRAYLAVAGRLLDLSSLPRDATWPHD